MIVIEECKIIRGKELILDASIEDFALYNNVSIGGVFIDTDETFVSSGPSEEPVFSLTLASDSTSQDDTEDSEEDEDDDTEDYTYNPKADNNKHIRLRVTAKEMGLSDLNSNLFIIYIKAVGVPSSDTPCGKDKEYVSTITFDVDKVYREGLRRIELAGRCDVPMLFCDWYMRLKAVDLACQMGNYESAVAWWKKLFAGMAAGGAVSDCGCDG